MKQTAFKLMLGLVALTGFSAMAHAGKSLTYEIDSGAVGVISSASGGARLVIQAGSDCRAVPYSIVADGVLAAKGNFDLSNPISLPLDYTNVTLSCTPKAVQAKVEQVDKGGLF